MNTNNTTEPDAEENRWIETDAASVQFDPSTETYRTVHNWNQHDSISTTLIEAVSAVVGEQSTTLPPLFESVDPDALDSVFEPTTATPRTAGRISIPYAGFLVTIYADGEITFTASQSTTHTGEHQ